MSRQSTVSAVIYLVVVFLSGALVGAFAYRLYMVNSVSGSNRSPEEYRRHYVAEMTSRLHLSTDQVSNLQRIMDETRQRYKDLHDRQRPDMKVIENEQYEKVKAMLTEPQRTEYDKMRAERERRRQQQSHRK